VKLFDDCKRRETYIGQFELIAAITPFVSLPREWFVGRPVELWIDKYSGRAIGALLNGYSGVPDCARIVNMFDFAVAKAGCASLWIDYVPSESNPADVPSRLIHEMTVDARGALEAESTYLGTKVERMHSPHLQTRREHGYPRRRSQLRYGKYLPYTSESEWTGHVHDNTVSCTVIPSRCPPFVICVIMSPVMCKIH
jgi:hypothetical protein